MQISRLAFIDRDEIGTKNEKEARLRKAMLKGIPPILSPKLLKALCEMGHSDYLVIADGNFPSQSIGRNRLVIRMDGHGAAELLEAILQVFPLDTYVDYPVILMDKAVGDQAQTPMWQKFTKLVAEHDQRGAKAVRYMERPAFYEKAKGAYLIIATSETALYANVILQKGVVQQRLGKREE